MRAEDFDLLCGILKQRSGLVLSKDKVYLIESRLMPVARKHGFKKLEDLISSVRLRREESLLSQIAEAMTTNESLFFRDIWPFEVLRTKVLPRIVDNRPNRTIRIWSAACSSGQEPYSISMVLKEQARRMDGWRFEVVATDLSREMLMKAKTGFYTQFEVQRGLPVTMLVKYFKQIGDKWQIDASIRSMVKFCEFNLLNDPRSLGRFDVVFCRNVLIYFDQATKKRVLERISQNMPSDGVLYLGGAETVLGVTDRFQPMPGQRGVYCLSSAAGGVLQAAVG
jgi:chemotaxis protein methyltransferase CheR